VGRGYFTQLTNITPLADGQVISLSYSSGVVDQSGTAYIGNVEYNTLRGNSSLTAISRIYNAEGYVESPANPQYHYFRKDHLGSNREVWLAPPSGGGGAGNTVQRTQYYPSGLPWASNTGDNPGLQNKKYNGKEFVEMHGYDTYDYGARGYYAAISRWTSVDPLAEKYYSISPYVYCAGNPVNRIDPDGKQIFGLNIPFSPLLGVDPILLSNKPVATETMARVVRATTETASKIEDHHGIPRALRDNPVVKEARNEGFKFDGKENKISVDKFSKQTGEGQHGNHPSYTKEIQNKLSDFQKDNPGFTGKDALNAVRNIVKDIKETIQNNPNTKINDLYKVPSDNIKSYVPVIIMPQKKQ